MRRAAIALFLIATSAMSGAAPRPAAPAADDFLYVVKPGDTLVGIAARGFRRPGDYLIAQRYNRLRNDRRMAVGSTLRLPRAILRTEAISARVIAFRGAATIRVAGGEPAPVKVGMTIPEGAILATGANAFLSIEIADGSLVTLPSRSRMAVGALHRVALTGAQNKRFDLQAGRSEAAVEPVDRNGGQFEIRTPVSVAAVRGTEFRMTYDEASASAGTSVVGGRVAVAAGANEVSVPAGEGVVAYAGGAGVPVALLAAPTLADPDLLQDAEVVTLAITPVVGAKAYRAQVATDAGFVDIIAEGEAAGPVVTIADVPNGSLFARVSALSPAGLEGLAKSYSVERRQNNITAETGAPDDCPATRCMRFRWRAGGEGNRRFRFQIASAKDGVPIVDLPELTGTQVVLTDLPGGSYYWRVESSLIDQGKRQSKWMEHQELRVAPAQRR